MALSYCVLDIEATKIPRHLPWHKDAYISSICIEDQDGMSKVWFFNPCLEKSHEESTAEIQDILNSVDYIVGHNIKFDLGWLQWIGLDVSSNKVWCTQIADYLLNGQTQIHYSLNTCAERYNLGSKLDAMKMYWDAGYETDEIPVAIHEEYVKQDVNLTHQLFLKQLPLIEQYGLSKLAEVCFGISKLLSEVEVAGVLFDKNEAEAYVDSATQEFESLDQQLIDLAGVQFNPHSPAQLKAVMFGGQWSVDGKETYEVTLKNGTVKERTRKCKIPVTAVGLGFDAEAAVSNKTGSVSTGKDVLETLVPPTECAAAFLDVLKDQRKLAKVMSSIKGSKDDTGLVNVIGSDEHIHPSFNQTVTRTGRLSSSNPNGQNLPRKGTSPIKKFFVPSNDYIVNLDLGQIEWRVAAELSRDPVMIHELETDVDIHTDNAVRFFGAGKYNRDSKEFDKLRTTAKVLTFRSLYGGSAYAFYKDPRMPNYSLKKWESIVNAFYSKYKGLKAWQDANVALVNKQGFLRTPSGRYLSFSRTVDKRSGEEGWDTKQIYNYPVQSVSADIMFITMLMFKKFLVDNKLKSRIVLQVHDSMVLDCPADEVERIVRAAPDFFRAIPKYAKEFFNWDIVVPLVGDAEVGYTYGSTVKCKESEFDIIFKNLDAHLTKK